MAYCKRKHSNPFKTLVKFIQPITNNRGEMNMEKNTIKIMLGKLRRTKLTVIFVPVKLTWEKMHLIRRQRIKRFRVKYR